MIVLQFACACYFNGVENEMTVVIGVHGCYMRRGGEFIIYDLFYCLLLCQWSKNKIILWLFFLFTFA